VVQTLDFFPPVVDDPYVFGAVAAANAMSDVYAMGGEVALALNIAAFPEDMAAEVIAEVFRGGADKVAEAGGVVAGGHTVIDAEPKYGMSVMGTVHPQRVLTKAGARPGDALVLTKAIGTGVILTAAKRDQATAADLEAAVASMLQLNRHAAHLARAADAHAVTDVTGYALAGHALEIAEHSRVQLVVRWRDVPLLPGAAGYASAGVDFGGLRRNREQLGARVRLAEGLAPEAVALAFDPQTSGGLLMAVPAAKARRLVHDLSEAGYGAAAVIGEARPGAGLVVET
jgi:selenide,water dikinase